MTGQEMLKASCEVGGNIVVAHKRSGKLYHLEADVIHANSQYPNPYLYGWPVKKHPRATSNPVWFYGENVRFARPDETE